VEGGLPDGFVAGIDPADAAGEVSFDRETITVTFNQPMNASGDNGSADWPGQYRLDAMPASHPVQILDVLYDEGAYTATIFFDPDDPNWRPDQEYGFLVRRWVKNACGVIQGENVVTSFTVAPAGPAP
jgi:hypothetical protein